MLDGDLCMSENFLVSAALLEESSLDQIDLLRLSTYLGFSLGEHLSFSLYKHRGLLFDVRLLANAWLPS